MAVVTTPAGAQVGTILISYTLTDAQSHAASIIAEYSLDGGATYSGVTQGVGGGGTTGLATSPGGTAHTFAWDSLADAPGQYVTTVRVRFTPSDAASGTAGSSGDFTVDNNTAPSAGITTPSGSQAGNILLRYTLSDPDSSTVAIAIEFSTDGGVTFWTATEGAGGEGTTGLTSSPGGTAHVVAWHSGTDLPGVTSATIQFRITPSDAEAGTLIATGSFSVANTPPETTRASVDSAGTQGNGGSSYPDLSADGRYVAFQSNASNLVAGDTNGQADILVCDRVTGATTRVSIDSAGAQANGSSSGPSISTDGRYVAFESWATNLVAGDTNGQRDIFVHDRQTAETTRVSVDSAGIQADAESREPSISDDGHVVFTSFASNLVPGDTNGSADVFVHDRQTSLTTRVSVDSAGMPGNGVSDGPSISADGRYVAFDSWATNLVAGDTNFFGDVFVHDRQTGLTARVSVDSADTQGNLDSVTPDISADGRFVVFRSGATNLVASDTNGSFDVFVHDRQTGLTTRASVDSAGTEGNADTYGPNISADGRFVVFRSGASNLVASDTNGSYDVFVHDRQTGHTFRASVTSSGVEATGGDSGDAAISSDGRFVAYWSLATNLVAGDTNGVEDVFVSGPRFSPPTVRASVDSAGGEGTGLMSQYLAAITPDGRFVAFSSGFTNLVSGDTNGVEDTFVHDRATAATTRVSVDSSGAQANGDSLVWSMSSNGRFVALQSSASNLVAGDTNAVEDAFLHDRQTGATVRISVDSAGTQGNGPSGAPSVSADGRLVAFESRASNLVAGDTNGQRDIFLRDTQTATTTRLAAGVSGDSGSPRLSPDGRFVAFYSDSPDLVAGDTNGMTDVFLLDRQTSSIVRVSVATGGAQATGLSSDPVLSADGQVVAFDSSAPDLVAGDTNGQQDIFVRDIAAGTTTRVSVDSQGAETPPGVWSAAPSISADGRFVAFHSTAGNLVLGDTNVVYDIFIHDRITGTTTRVSLDTFGVQGNGYSILPALSADGRFVAFLAAASNLVNGDTNGASDIFVSGPLR